jgi:hypothetical protein
MAQANTENSTTTPAVSTRRRFLSQAAGVAAGSAVLIGVTTMAAPAVASHGGPDPILEAIEAHKAARATWLEWVYRHGDLEDELPKEKRQSNIDVWEELIIFADDPRWIEAERELKRTGDLETDAAVVLVTVQPTTLAGILALLKYAVEAVGRFAWVSELSKLASGASLWLWRRDRDARLLARHHEHEPPQADHRWHAPQTVRR